MAGQTLSISDPEVVNVWERTLDREVRARDPLFDTKNGLAGEGQDSLIQQKDQLTDGPGAFIRTKLRYQIDGRGRVSDEVLKGHETSYKTSTFDTYVDTVRQAYAVSSPIVQQWTTEKVLEEGRDGLADWFASRFSLVAHAHATGIPITDDAYRMHNTINAINETDGYLLRPNGKTAGNLTSGDFFDIDLINEAARTVKLLRPKIRPAQTPWGPRFCVFLAPEQVKSLRDSNSLWFSNMRAAMQGGRVEDNPIFTTALGEDQGFVFFESDFVPPGLNSGGTALKANTRRAWIGGAQSLFMAFGRGYAAPGYSLNRFQWVYESEDYQHQQAIAAATICGIARPRYLKPGEARARESGVLVIETYADPGSLSTDTIYRDWTAAGLTIEA